MATLVRTEKLLTGYDGDERAREVRRVRSTCETAEQKRCCGTVGGGRGGKGLDRREIVTAKHAPDSEPDGVQNALEAVRKAAKVDKKMRFTALMHHIYDVEFLREAYFGINRDAAPGIDGETWEQYGEALDDNLQELSGRLKRGAYRAKPVKRVFIAKPDGRQRPLGVPALEDKIVQKSTVKVLNAIYETDFLGFSYGFRPVRNPHNALDALYVGLQTKKVSWVLDADIRGFFDAIDHEWLIKFIEHRIADKRVVHLIQKWLKAGVLENGQR